MKSLLTVMMILGLATAACGVPETETGFLVSTTQPSPTTIEMDVSTTTTSLLVSKQDPPTTATSSQETTTTVASDNPEFDPALERLVDLATADLAARLGLSASAITVVSAEAVVWPDAGLGCPEPGMAYIQVPVDGALIVLAAGGTEYRYHSGGRVTTPFLCEN